MKANNFDSGTEVLHNRGWVRVKILSSGKLSLLGNCIDLTRVMRNTIDPAMNNRQMRVAKRLCLENNTLFHEAVNDKRFW